MALKTGSEDKKKVIIAATLGVVVLGLAGYQIFNMFGGSTPPPAAPVSVSTAAPTPVSSPGPGPVQHRMTVGQGHEAAKIGNSMARLDPTLHPELMAAAESLEYTGKGRNIFSMSSVAMAIEPVKGPFRTAQNAPVVPAGPPPPPPIDLKFFGFEAVKSGTRKAFLLHGDDVFIAAEGDVVDHRYKVVKIAPFSLQVEDIPYNNTQTLPLVQN
ncbi:hypothetical protein HNQ77_000270 [Silvibacterium bohemicum]|uniref:Uncharacterized protein n=1 Tax=Silvibacterium bohemicum TaxID=1577686 RepID=A0A841JLS7_9BACT|nr:hypothetical protein [Silvibacterium bohemicum]MBB6142332.1 hypothetical protein [Silvibacterium bohemicum]